MMFKGKKFLLTHIWLRGFAGAEINILELATFLQSEGAYVDVYTLLYQEPMKEKFIENSIKVIDDSNYNFQIEDYDYIWVSQSILPPSIIKRLGQKNHFNTKFLFMHMAALDDYVLEQPYIYELEEKISSATLAISKEIIYNNLNRFFEDVPNLQLYPNPVPVAYGLEKYKHQSKKLRRLLVLSNHPPKEIKDLKEVLAEKNIVVDYYGVWSDKYELVSPRLFQDYDCVIGIGKNVQYCLAMGKPIYVYDHFNGPGFLNDTNFELAATYNFSGRGFETDKKDTEEIVKELLEGFDKSLNFHEKHRGLFKTRYAISNVVSSILKTIDNEQTKSIVLNKNYSNYVMSMNLLVKNTIVRLDNDVKNLWKQIHIDNQTISDLQEKIGNLSKENERLGNRYHSNEQKLDKILNSGTYKFAMKLSRIKSKLLFRK